MTALTLILLLLAYTLGIATLVVQLICYIRKIEYLETIVLVISFLLLLLSSAILEYEYVSLQKGHTVTTAAMYFFTIILAYTIPLNTHRERILSNRARRNRWAMILSVSMVFLQATSFLFHFEQFFNYAIIAFLNISVLYSMITVIMSKPSLLVKHRERTERLSAIGISVIMVSIVAAGFIFFKEQITSGSILKGPVILSVICIILCLLKLPDPEIIQNPD